MTVLYKLASEQLSKQFHYDWGLRALTAVLRMAGVLRRSSPDLSETLVLMRALRYIIYYHKYLVLLIHIISFLEI